MQRFKRMLLLCGLLAARGALAQIVGPADYIVGSIPLPGTAQGDVALSGTSLIVGQGSFGPGAQSVVRRDFDGAVTSLATGFNSLSGFAVTPAGDLLFVTDNGGEQAGATTGDTLFAIPDPRTAGGARPAAGLEVAAPGSIPFAQAVALAADGEPLVSDATGATAGRVLRHQSFGFPPFTSFAAGFGYTAGLAFASNGHLFVGDVDGTTLAGRVVELDADGTMLRTLAGGLSGVLDLAIDRRGQVLVSGGFLSDFSSSTIVAIDDNGAVGEFARGFSFSSGLDVDPISGRVYALDFGKPTITTFTPIAALLPGGGAASTDCFAELSDVSPALNRAGRPKMRSDCHDGAACDRDGVANGVCTFALGACLNVPGQARCTPGGVESFRVEPVGGVVDPQLAALATLAGAVLPTGAAQCVGPVPVAVPLRSTASGLKPATKLVRTTATHTPATGKARKDGDRLVLRCLP